MSVFVAARIPLTFAAILTGGLMLCGPAGAEDTVPVAQPLPAAAPVTVSKGPLSQGSPRFADIVDRVLPAVVSLTTNKARGSGFIVDPSGDVVTNNHVIAGATEIEVSLSSGAKYKARLVGRDEATDIALLKIDAARPLPSVRFGDDASVRIGDWVIAVGNPLGLGGTVTAGILSARHREGAEVFTDYIQVDAAINPGNSGGPTFDLSGRVIGINTLVRASPLGGAAAGIGFAIPSSTAQRVVRALKEGHAVDRGFVGVQIDSLSDDTAQALGLPSTDGALVTDVVEGSPAQAAGIKRGDVILKINGQSVKDSRELLRRIAGLDVGQTATFTIWRDNKQINVTIQVAKREVMADAGGVPSKPNAEVKLTSLGLGLTTITPDMHGGVGVDLEGGGVLITDIDLSSDAAQRGLRPGDRIVAVGGDDVKSLGDVNLAVEQAKALKRPVVLLFVVTKSGSKNHVAVKLKPN